MAKQLLERLLRSPRKVRKSDLLSDREYNALSATTFEEFLRSNLNTEQLRLLTTAEENQLEMYYQLRERKAERSKKLMRDKLLKPKRTAVPPVVVRYVPNPAPTQEVLQTEEVPQEGTPEDASDIRHLVGDIENRLKSIDLSQAMPPPELLLVEPPAQSVPIPIGTIEEELDLGPPGDAAAFFGVDHPMPVSDREVMDRLRQEFPSLGRPSTAGRFEDLEVAPLPAAAAAKLMPPPAAGTGISASTPIVANPTICRFYNTDLSAIKAPGVTREAPKEKEHEQPDTTAARKSPTVPAPVPQIESSPSVEQPVRRPPRVRKIFRKVPTFGDHSIPVPLRSLYDMATNSVPEMFEQTRVLIQSIIDSRPAGVVPQARRSAERLSLMPSLPTGIEGHPVMRDISAIQAELSSIREPPGAANQSKLYPIQEQPQQEQPAEQQLQAVPISVPVGESTLPPMIEPVMAPVPGLAEVPQSIAGQTNQSLDTGLGNQMLFPDSSVEPQPERPQETSNNEALTSILQLYLKIQREAAHSRRNEITADRLAQITSVDRLASAKRFQQLLTLKKWGFIELKSGETSHLKTIALRQFD